MTITASQIKEIRLEFAKLKPVTVTLDGNLTMSVKEAIFALAPTLERMKKRGFEVQELVERLHEKGIVINDMKSSGKKRDKLGSIGTKFRLACNFIAESETKKEGICPSFFVVLNAL